MNQVGWIRTFIEKVAFWKHDGNPRRPHALLTSGNHSDGFFNGSLVVMDPRLVALAAHDLIMKVVEVMGVKIDVEMVIGSAFGAITLAHEIARQAGTDMGFTEPVVTEAGKEMVLKRFSLEKGAPVIVVEDVMTTGSTTRKTIAEIETQGGLVLEPILVLVNRSGMSKLEGRRIIALVDTEMPIWKSNECPLCKQGSEALRPKGNWDKLTANYWTDC